MHSSDLRNAVADPGEELLVKEDTTRLRFRAACASIPPDCNEGHFFASELTPGFSGHVDARRKPSGSKIQSIDNHVTTVMDEQYRKFTEDQQVFLEQYRKFTEDQQVFLDGLKRWQAQLLAQLQQHTRQVKEATVDAQMELSSHLETFEQRIKDTVVVGNVSDMRAYPPLDPSVELLSDLTSSQPACETLPKARTVSLYLKKPSIESIESIESEGESHFSQGSSASTLSGRPSELAERPNGTMITHAASSDMFEALVAVKGWNAKKSLHQSLFSPLQSTSYASHMLMYLSVVLVMLNTLFVGFQANFDLEQAKEQQARTVWLMWMDLSFTIAFSLELTTRALMYKSHFFTGDDRLWNAFDCAMTVTSLLEWVLDMIDLSFMRSLRICRAVRVVRVFRIANWVRELRLMVGSVICSLSSLVWACIFLFFEIYLFAVIITVHVANHIRSHGDVDPSLILYYGSLGDSMVSLFMATTGGVDWSELLRPLQDVHYAFYTVFFIFYVVFTVFGVMNVLTAVFVDAASHVSELDRDLLVQEHMEKTSARAGILRKLFREADTDNSNTVSLAEFQDHLQNDEVVAHLKVLELDIFEVRGLFQLLDINQKGEVDIDEFVVGMMRLKGGAKGVDVASLIYENRKVVVRLAAFMKFVQNKFSKLEGLLDVNKTVGRKLTSTVEEYVIREEAFERERMQTIHMSQHMQSVKSMGETEASRVVSDGSFRNPRSFFKMWAN